MRFVSAEIRPVGACFQLTVIHYYGLLSGAWPTVTTHTSLHAAVDALIRSRCGVEISFVSASGAVTESFVEYESGTLA